MLTKHYFAIAALVLLASCSQDSTLAQSHNDQCPAKLIVEKQDVISGVFPTDVGMHGLWDFETFKDICSDKGWESHFVESANIVQHIKRGAFVPIYVYSDGAPTIEVRIASQTKLAELSSIEKTLIAHQSEPYLFISKGQVSISGIEYISGNYALEASSALLEPGRWTVTVYLMNAQYSSEKVRVMALPDFIVTMNRETKKQRYRTVEGTFDDLY